MKRQKWWITFLSFQTSAVTVFEVSRSRVFMLFPSSLWVNRNKKEKFWLHIFRVPVCPYARMPVCPYARMPVYRVLFRLKFSSVSGHMIKFLLTEFGGASAEIIRFGLMKKRPRCARSVGHDPEPSIFSVRPYYSMKWVFRFCTSLFYHSWCNWTWKMISVILF